MTTYEDDTRERPNISDSTHFVHNVDSTLQSRSFGQLHQCLGGHLRQDRNDHTKFIEKQTYQYSKSQEDLVSQRRNEMNVQNNLHQQQISPRSILDSWRTDPFNTYPIDSSEMQPYMHSLVDYRKYYHFFDISIAIMRSLKLVLSYLGNRCIHLRFRNAKRP